LFFPYQSVVAEAMSKDAILLQVGQAVDIIDKFELLPASKKSFMDEISEMAENNNNGSFFWIHSSGLLTVDAGNGHHTVTLLDKSYTTAVITGDGGSSIDGSGSVDDASEATRNNTIESANGSTDDLRWSWCGRWH